MSRVIILFGLCALLFVTASPLFAFEELKVIPNVEGERLILVEGQSYCSAGVGVGHTAAFVENQRVSAAIDPNLPNIRGSKSVTVNLDCYVAGWFAGYGFVEDNFTLDTPVTIGLEQINHGQIHIDSFYAGKQFSLIPHRLYLDLGAGVYQMESTFSRYNLLLDFAGTPSRERGMLGMFRSTWMFHPTLYATWTVQKGLDSQKTLLETNSLSIYFWKRF